MVNHSLFSQQVNEVVEKQRGWTRSGVEEGQTEEPDDDDDDDGGDDDDGDDDDGDDDDDDDDGDDDLFFSSLLSRRKSCPQKNPLPRKPADQITHICILLHTY